MSEPDDNTKDEEEIHPAYRTEPFQPLPRKVYEDILAHTLASKHGLEVNPAWLEAPLTEMVHHPMAVGDILTFEAHDFIEPFDFSDWAVLNEEKP